MFCKQIFHFFLPSINDHSFHQEIDVTNMIRVLKKSTLSICCFYVEYVDSSGIAMRSLKDMIPTIQKNGSVLVTFTDSSYLSAFYTSYQVSHLDKYSNFLVVAMDEDAYHVIIPLVLLSDIR